MGKGITVMFSPLPRNKRARNPRQDEIDAEEAESAKLAKGANNHSNSETKPVQIKHGGVAPKEPPAAFSNNPFAKVDLEARQDAPPNPPAEA